MSTTPPPPEQPTRRLDPSAPPPPPVYERVVEPGIPVAADASMLIVRLEDAISSLRTALIFVGLLAVIATGIAIYALTRADDTPVASRGNAASETRVARLEDRVDRLSRQVQAARVSARSASGLNQRVDDLAKSVATLRAQSGDAAAAPDATQAITDLDGRLDRLEQQIQSLDTAPTTP